MKHLGIFLILCSALFAANSTINEDTIHFVGQASAFTVGGELITDGGFPSFDNWTEGTWTLAGGVASEDNAGGNSDLSQSLSNLTNGRVYRIQFEVTAFTDGLVSTRFDGVEIANYGSTGVFTGYGVATGTTAFLTIRANATFTGSVDNVSIVAWTGDLNAGGGCTISSFTGTLSDYMSATGGVLHNASGLALSNDGGNLAIASGGTWNTEPQAGTLVKCDFSAALTSINDGVFEIITASASSITIDGDSTGFAGKTAEVWIGGAYPDIATIVAVSTIPGNSTLSEDPDGTYRKRYICVNVDQEVDAVTDFVAETSDASLQEDDGSRKIIGFYDSVSVTTAHSSYRIVSDMDEGQLYYAGARKAFAVKRSFTDPKPAGKWIEWNGKGNNINIIEFNTSNFELRNFKVHNVNTGGTYSLLRYDDGAVYDHSYINCNFDVADRLLLTDQPTTGSVFRDCYFSSGILDTDLTAYDATLFVGCIFDGTGKTYAANNSSGLYLILLNNLFYQGQYGVRSAMGMIVMGNTFYGQTESCVRCLDPYGGVLVINNIFSPAAIDDSAIIFEAGEEGTLVAGSSSNIFYSVQASAIITDPLNHANISPNNPLPVGSIEKDPLFVNPADGDFRLRANSPALNAGLRSLFDGWTTIGANQPYSSPNAGYRSRYNFKGHNYSDR